MSVSRSVPAEWMVRANSTCLRGEVAARSLSDSSLARMSSELSGVRSSCDMLARNSRLVLRRERELLGLLLEHAAWPARPRGSCARPPPSARQQLRASPRAPRWSAAALPAAPCSRSSDDLQRLGLLLEALVGLGQLLLLGAQLLGERLRLLEQLLGAHVGGDGVEHDADRLGELIEERQVDVAEAVERRQLDDGLDLALRRAPAGR